MQHRLPESTIDFYCNILGCESSDRKFEKPTVLQPLRQWDFSQDMIANMIRDYIQNFNVEDRRSSSPFIIFCSRVDFSLMLYQLFCEAAQDAFPEEVCMAAVDRIKGVWAQVQNNQWNSHFLRDPNSYAIDCDVLIVTSVLQAGHSLYTHFTTSYDVLFNNVLSFREELQFTSRLRYLDKADVRQYKHAWIEKAISNRNIASMNRITTSLASLMAEDTSSGNTGIISSIIAAVTSERADTSNRHDFLWCQEYKLSTVSRITVAYDEDQHSHSIYSLIWVKDKIKHYMKGKGAQTIKTLMQGMNAYECLNLTNLLDEAQYVHVADLLSNHALSNTATLQERVRQSENQTHSFNVITNILKVESLLSSSSISKSLQPYYNLITFLDYRIFLLNPNDSVKQRYWNIRLSYRSNDPSHKAKIRMAKMLNKLINGNMLCKMIDGPFK